MSFLLKLFASTIASLVMKALLYLGIYRAGQAAQHSADVEGEKDTLERERDVLARGEPPLNKALNEGDF